MSLMQKYIDQLNKEVINNFDCGSSGAGFCFKSFFSDPEGALQLHKEGSATTSVIVDEINESVVGYYTLKCSSLLWEHDDEHTGELVQDLIPAIELSCFAIDVRYQGEVFEEFESEKMKYSEFVMDYVMDAVVSISQCYAGVSVIILYSLKDDKVMKFYKTQGFKELNDGQKVYQQTDYKDCIPMYKFVKRPDDAVVEHE